MNFTKDNFKTILQLLKPENIDFHNPGNGIILRHDVDQDLEKSFRCALIENEIGVKSTYFILNTADYWQDLPRTMQICNSIQSMGHEIGWHNNAITEHYLTGKPIFDCINDPIETLRAHGLKITLTVGHGCALCHEKKYINYNVFGFRNKNDGYDGYTEQEFKLSDFGLVMDALWSPHELILADSMGKWNRDPDAEFKKWQDFKKRYQVLIHPQWWPL
jgi:hypothetical protein